MNDRIFHLAFVVIFIVFFGIRGYYFRRAQRTRGQVTYLEGRGHRLVRLLAGGPFMLALVGYMVRPELLAWAELPLPGGLRWVGLALGLLSVALMLWVQRTLGRTSTPRCICVPTTPW